MSTSEPRISGSGLIAGAIIVSALIVSWTLPDAPRYQLAGSGAAVFRMDSDSGALIACDTRQCREVQPADRARTLGPLQLQIGRRGDQVPAAGNAQ